MVTEGTPSQGSGQREESGENLDVPNDQTRFAALELQSLPRQDLSNPNRGNGNLEEQDTHPPRHETEVEQSQTEEISHVDLEMQDLKAKMEGVMQAMKGKGIAAIDGLVQKTNLPFSPSVMKCPLPSKFRMPTIESFDGTKDPLDQLETFQALMHLHAMPDEIMCKAFPTTLKGSARVWFNKLKPGTIETFEELSKGFMGHFIAGQRHRRPTTHLLIVKQQKGESLRDYISRFNTEILQVEEADDKVALAAFIGGLQTSRFLFSLSEEPSTSMAELLIQDEPYLKWPPKLKSDPARRPRDKYCRFHKDHGHATEDCFDLKDQIETLIRRGHMRKFIMRNDRTDINPLRACRDNRLPDQQPIGEIRVIAGGCAGGGESSSARKAYARRMRSSSGVQSRSTDSTSKDASFR
ncbi:uncharacterized protein LOC132270005 [Cornus florida]|uniref:uncharacterized protein LOC132270005 n=1 Tax=Cornus florida TaxID=4283 RepID=UPI00289B6DAA|nr:uncharacterized protein LOC132270005 [Cornus florida]